MNKRPSSDMANVFAALFFIVVGCTLPAVTGSLIFRCAVKDCYCERSVDQIDLDCAVRSLQTLPELEQVEANLATLDLSDNKFEEYPSFLRELPALTVLDLSNNLIDTITPDTQVALLPSLRILQLNGNKIASWSSLRALIASYANLEELRLADNLLTSISSYDEQTTLQAANLRVLDLSDCKIAKITGQFILRGLPRLEQLILRGNPLRSMPDMHSMTLQSLDLSNCRLTFLQPNLLQNLPALRSVNLARNSRVSLSRKPEEMVHSVSVQRLDLSYCNMDTIEIAGFPNLTAAILRGNLINRLRKDSFELNGGLEELDLSANAITHVSNNALQRLPRLKHLDLSFNMIRRIERDTFRYNAMLTGINLSRNFIERMSRIDAQSLTHLNMSWCEVLNIDLDAFSDMPELLALDLSNNLFGEFPVTLQSAKLQTLDLSMCRLSIIRNETFVGFPDLAELRLSGNRFTTPFRAAYFAENPYLRDIWLGDNPWRCDCADPSFNVFYNYLTEGPGILRDHVHLRCLSPEEAYGQTWEVACAERWFAGRSTGAEAAQKVWSFLMLSIVLFVAAICVIMSIRRCIENRNFERREAEREQNRLEAREIMRRNQSILEQEAQLNAPDPRESRPPCYDDAILLPKFSGSYASLRAKFKPDSEDETDGGQIPLRNRSRSEEVLSPRESVVEQNRQTRRQIIAEANQRISVHPVLEIPPRVALVPERSPIPTSPARRMLSPIRSSIAEDDDSDSDDSDIDRISLLVESRHIEIFDSTQSSPYAQRRTTSASVQPQAGPSHRRASDLDAIRIVDDHYRPTQPPSQRQQQQQQQSANSSGSTSENSSAAFTMIG